MAVGLDWRRWAPRPGFEPETSAVGLLAIEYARNFYTVTLVAEENAVVLGAKADNGRFDAAKPLRISLGSLSVAGQGFEDLQSNGLCNAANVALRLLGPDDAL
jgi:hypothetical protein